MFSKILLPLKVSDYTVKGSFSFAKEVINFDHNIVVYQHSHRRNYQKCS